MALEDDGFEVDAFNDSTAALSAFKPNYYDALIFDIRMPTMNGYELYEKVNKLDDKVKVCFLTALNEMHDYQDYKKEVSPKPGERYFIQKPVENQTLIKRVNEIIV